jgi:enoyl-CoA hydratase/carnithine racemase
MSDAVLVEISHHVATVRLNRPEVRNALGPDLMDELATQLEHLDDDPEVRCSVIAGSNDVFASGADIRSLSEDSYQQALHHPAASFWRRLAAIRKPMVAAVSGWALGSGCELALACDLLVAAEKTQFGQPEVTLGIIPGGGATQRLARAIGKQRAMEMILTGRRFSAEQAYGWGMVNVVAPQTRWLEPAWDLAVEVGARAPIATRLAKQAVLEADQLSLEEGMKLERKLFEQAMATEDRIEGMNAFMQGRRPEFEGR